jgi:hypothetical protein
VSSASLLQETDLQALKKYASQYPRQAISVDILSSLFDETVQAIAGQTINQKENLERHQIEQESMKNHGQEVLVNVLKNKMGEGLTGVAIDAEGRLASHFIKVQSGPQITEHTFCPLKYKDVSARPFSQLTDEQK